MKTPSRIHVARVLCPVDFSACSAHALAHAAAIARWYQASLRVLHVHVVVPAVDMLPPLASPPATIVSTLEHRAQLGESLHGFVASAGGGEAVDVVVDDAPNVAADILDHAEAWSASLVVVGNHGRTGASRLLLGSVAEHVARLASCPVLIVPHGSDHPVAPGSAQFDRILCAVDFSDSSQQALVYGLSLAAETNARVTVLNTIAMPPELRDAPMSYELGEALRTRVVTSQAQRLTALIPDDVRQYCTVETSVVEGRASPEILRVATATQADLIVMGAQGRGALALALFGSNAHDVLRRASCPVLLVRAAAASALGPPAT